MLTQKKIFTPENATDFEKFAINCDYKAKPKFILNTACFNEDENNPEALCNERTCPRRKNQLVKDRSKMEYCPMDGCNGLMAHVPSHSECIRCGYRIDERNYGGKEPITKLEDKK